MKSYLLGRVRFYSLFLVIILLANAIVGSVDLPDLLSSMEEQIANAIEQAQTRKDILDKVVKWKHASEEEIWLDEYERVTLYLHCIIWSLQGYMIIYCLRKHSFARKSLELLI